MSEPEVDIGVKLYDDGRRVRVTARGDEDHEVQSVTIVHGARRSRSQLFQIIVGAAYAVVWRGGILRRWWDGRRWWWRRLR